MKKSIAIGLFTILSSSSVLFAQQQNTTMDFASSEPIYYTEMSNITFQKNNDPTAMSKKHRTFKGLRNSGIVITSIGSAFALAGTYLVLSSKNERYYDPETGIYYNSIGTDLGELVGTVAIIGGGAATLAGVTMWVIGQHHLNKEKKNITFNVSPNSVYLAYRF